MHAKTALVALLLIALQATASVHATETEGDLEAVQAHTMMLKAQVEQAKARKALADNGGLNGLADTSTGTPSVAEVYASAGTLYATFAYPDGTTQAARQGDHLPGDCLVLSVRLSAVRVQCNGQTRTVGFGSPAPRAQSQVANGMPAFMPAPAIAN